MINYPKDFALFRGKELTTREIDNLLQEALETSETCSPSEASGFLTGLWTGDTRIEVHEDNIKIWRLVANHYRRGNENIR